MKRLKIISISLLITGIALFIGHRYFSPGRPAGDGQKKIEYEVQKGKGVQSIGKELASQGLIRSAEYFRWILKLTGRSGKLKAGVYELNDGMSAFEVADVLTEGRVRMLALTIPEGWNNRQIGDYFASKGLVKDRQEFLDLASDPAVLGHYRIPGKTTEGYLFPDTYMVPLKYPAAKVQDIMIRRFFEVLEELEIKQTDPAELHRRVILASIVEREAKKEEERPIMSQVFLNRIEKRMRLESCATVQYLFDRPHPRLLEKDLFIESPYNTYRHGGLPPGPISNPGKAAISAAFHPDSVPYLFFARKPYGSHHFSVTFKEHLEAKKRFIDPLFAN